jgi:hypothetical protein
MKKSSEFRPIITYFLVVFLAAVLSLYGRLGWWSLAAGLLTVIVIGLAVPAPLLVHKYLQKKGLETKIRWLAGSYALSFVIITIVFSLQLGTIYAGILLGFLFYGYPGTLLFIASQLATRIRKT